MQSFSKMKPIRDTGLGKGPLYREIPASFKVPNFVGMYAGDGKIVDQTRGFDGRVQVIVRPFKEILDKGRCTPCWTYVIIEHDKDGNPILCERKEPYEVVKDIRHDSYHILPSHRGTQSIAKHMAYLRK